MKFHYLILICAGLANSTLARALTNESLIGCYRAIGTEKAAEFRIEKDQMKLGDSPETGKIVPYPGMMVFSKHAKDGGFLVKLENNVSNWTEVGDTSLQFFSRETVTEPSIGFLSTFVTFTLDKNGNMVLSYLDIFSSDGPSTRESQFAEVLEPKPCSW